MILFEIIIQICKVSFVNFSHTHYATYGCSRYGKMRGKNKWQKHHYLTCIVFAIWLIKTLFPLTGYFEGFKKPSFRVNTPEALVRESLLQTAQVVHTRRM